jgi:hypothetical protein
MSSTESSGAPAEASATTPAPVAAFPTFGSTRGSGLARGKRPAAGPAASTAAATEYTPTAIEVVNAPREYQNPFAPAETPAAVPAETVTPVPAASAPVAATPVPVAPAREYSAPVADPAPALSAEISANAEASANPEPVELNILPPAEQKTSPAQTWESEGFRPAREPRSDRPRREDRPERVAITEIPEKFLYVRPGHTYVPTPSNYGGAPRERDSRSAAPERAAASPAAPAKSGGFFGWLKSLFGGSSAVTPVATEGSSGEHRHEGGQRRHRGGRNRGGSRGGEGGGRNRSRGGRGGYRSEGSSQGGV